MQTHSFFIPGNATELATLSLYENVFRQRKAQNRCLMFSKRCIAKIYFIMIIFLNFSHWFPLKWSFTYCSSWIKFLILKKSLLKDFPPLWTGKGYSFGSSLPLSFLPLTVKKSEFCGRDLILKINLMLLVA